MNNIENTYIKYDALLQEFGDAAIQSRFEQILQEMKCFIHDIDADQIAVVNEVSLMHSILDYYSDISRLKSFHKIKNVNEMKIKAYETSWLIHRKPIQVIKPDLEDDKYVYINEKFILSRLTSYLLAEDINAPLVDEKRKAFNNFLETLYYYLKFRQCDAQAVELMLLSFKAGRLFS